ncbi:hypothetical protein PVT67_04030 [Gallaecimonas kandeliae]|uniref:hypothetical protein n=1 Tax=Gallaecimonas kandeliae TaxID=3029055 RepID=UPI0026484AE7|nr:hypothetical protein [Gallaecimonas kandeliae]WKE66430.1 hypothetical protein PVT67_04030 [Gallaecimonas kandeliae]
MKMANAVMIALVSLVYIPWAEANELACTVNSLSFDDAYVSHSRIDNVDKFNYSFTYKGGYWTAVVYIFNHLPSKSPLLHGIHVNEDIHQLAKKLYTNTKRALLQEKVTSHVDAPNYLKYKDGEVVFFTTGSSFGKDGYSLMGKKDKQGLTIYRTYYIPEKPGKITVNGQDFKAVTQALVESCSP